MLLYMHLRWLVRKNKDKKAARVLARIHHTDEKRVEEEIDSIKTALVQDTKKKGVWHTLKLFFTWKSIERSVCFTVTACAHEIRNKI